MRTGTDTLAVVCIVGGGLIAGGVTLALASGPALPSLECATTVGPGAEVVAALGGEGLVVVTPRTRVREVKECMAQDGIASGKNRARLNKELAQATDRGAREEVERARREADRVRREADRVREEVDRVRDRVRRAQVGEVDRRLEAELRAVEELVAAQSDGRRARDEDRRAERNEARARLDERMERVRERVERANERALRSQERAQRARERAMRVDRDDEGRLHVAVPGGQLRLRGDVIGVDGLVGLEALDGLDGVELSGSLSEGFRIALPGRSFQVRFEGLEDLDFDDADRIDGAEIEDAIRLQLEVLEGLDLDLEGIDETLAEEIELRLEEEMGRLRERLERVGSEGL